MTKTIKNNVKEQVSVFLKEAYSSKYDELEILIESSNNILARFADNDIIQSISQEKTSVRFRVIKDKKTGIASTNDLTEAGLLESFNKSLSVLKFMPKDKALITLFEDKNKFTEEFSYQMKTHEEKAKSIKLAMKYVEQNNMKSAGIDSETVETLTLLNSSGLEKTSSVSQSNFSISITAPTKGWAEETVKDSRSINHLEITKKAVDVALMNKDAISLDAKDYDVVLSPDAATDLFSFLGIYALNGKSFYEKTGAFTELDKKVLGDNISISDNPFHSLKKGFAFDYEGVDKKELELIKNGVIKNIPLDRKYADKLNKETTAHGFTQPNNWGAIPINLVVAKGNSNKEEMIKSTKYGLYVNRFHYSNIINPKDMTFTGMTRDGLFLIEDGKITKAVKNLRFTDSIIRLLNNVEMLSEDRKVTSLFMSPSSSAIVPFMKIKGFKFSSTTEF